MIALPLGFFGTLVWCIRFLTREPAMTRRALIVVFIVTVIAAGVLACPRLSAAAF